MSTNPLRRAAIAFAALIVIAGSAIITAPATQADQSISLTIGKFEIKQKLSKGQEYDLIGFGVVNPGDEQGSFRVAIAPMPDQTEEIAPESWFKVSNPSLTIGPKGTEQVPITLSIPFDARPAKYRTLLRAEIASPNGEGSSMGAAVAAPVTFEVKATTILEDWQVRAEDFASENQPWTWAVPSAIAALCIAWYVRRHVRISFSKA
jgi:hypothetical protein